MDVKVVVLAVPVITVKVVVEENSVKVVEASIVRVFFVVAVHVGTGIGNFDEQ